VARRWLPTIGLGESGPPVLGSAAERGGTCVWHVYDDLGDFGLDSRLPAPGSVAPAVELIAQMHTRFAEHAMLGEVRLYGGDVGIHFYESNLHDARCALETWRPAGEQIGLRDRLLERLGQLRDELPARAQAHSAWGGPDTLLHGDLWTINVFVIPGPDGLRARLIDWDHAGAGPLSYDLSTFLLRFPAQHRSWVLELYRHAVAAAAGWRLPDERKLNYLFETHEYARFANHIIWPAIALATEHAEWGVAVLAEVEQWFKQYQPVLPVVEAVAA
jgi:aminoglycoside/choline kinase family phosphotransferase